MQRDLYEILGVARDATDEEIKRAFRRRAMDCHPDRHPNDPTAENRFKELHEAYRILCDPHERAYYDRTGRKSGRAHSDPFGFGADPSELFEELFGQFFGGFRGRSNSSKGADIRVNIRVSFEEAATGTQARIKAPRKETCPKCSGSGAEPGYGSVMCPICNGTGRTEVHQGLFSFPRTCKRCGGLGRVIRNKCMNCAGTGVVTSERNLTVKVPPGVHDGARLKLAGEGNAARSPGQRGDLYVVVNVDPHPRFTRRDDDIVLEMPIGFTQAALGAELTVPTLDGEERLRIPPGTQTGRIFRLRNLGMPRLRGGGRGDMHVVVHVDVPTKLTEEERELLRKFAELRGEETEPKHRSFFDKVRDILA